MEIGQNIKEFTDQGEVVLIYTISSGGQTLQITNANAAVVSYSVDSQQIICGTEEFMSSRVDSRAKIWAAQVDDDVVTFTNVEGQIPSQVSYSLCEDGFQITKLDGLDSVSELEPFYICTDQNATLTINNRYQNKPLDQLDRASEIEVEGWRADLVLNVAQLEDSTKKTTLRSSMPFVKISKKDNSLSLLTLDEKSKYIKQEPEQGLQQAVDHVIIYSFELK